jgi:hypothetical protein
MPFGITPSAPSAASETDPLALLKANNLSDLANPGTARSNLGLGTAALAALAALLQAANNLSDLANAATARANLGLGTAATKAVGTTASDVAAGDEPLAIPKSIGTTKGDIITFTASGTPVRRAVGSNGASLVPNSSNSDGFAYEYSPQWFPTYKSGWYYYFNSPSGSSTSISMTNNRLNLSPFVVTKTLSITRIGTEFTVAGEANSVFRPAVYADDGNGQPTGAALIDPGTISTGTGNAGTVSTGGTPGCYEITVSYTFQPGVYWIGGAVQGAATTQPTMRIIASASIIAPIAVSSSIPAANFPVMGYRFDGVSGALPTLSGTPTGTDRCAKLFFKAA